MPTLTMPTILLLPSSLCNPSHRFLITTCAMATDY